MPSAAVFLSRLPGTPVARLAVALLCACCLVRAAAAAPSCAPGPGLTPARLAEVIDGDTLALADGTRLRLIGVNAPETRGRDGNAEAGAVEATRFARRFLGSGRIGVVPGVDRRDRYGRTLAHVYRADGESLEAALLAAGLARQVTVPPNLGQLECLRDAENSARATRAGLWRHGAFAPRATATLAPGESGFRLLRGRVSAVQPAGSTWWVEIDDRVSLRIADADRKYFSLEELRALAGRQVEVRGWLLWRDPAPGRGHPPWMMQLRHPASLAPDA
ncbi:MAG: thermonuclease family protein [Pseudomonadales bacterium]|nr:thermonuclease family protein [Pseudomonadales bacterium]